jgi:hypothetical protein
VVEDGVVKVLATQEGVTIGGLRGGGSSSTPTVINVLLVIVLSHQMF